MDIGTMHTEVLVSNDLFDVGDINGDGRTDVAYFDYDAGQYVFRYAEIGAATSEAFNLENDTGDAVVGVIGGAGNDAENVSFVAAGAKLYILNTSANGETVNLSDQPHLTTSAQIKSISLSNIYDAAGKTLLIGLGDENGLSSILRVAPSTKLLQVDIENAPGSNWRQARLISLIWTILKAKG